MPAMKLRQIANGKSGRVFIQIIQASNSFDGFRPSDMDGREKEALTEFSGKARTRDRALRERALTLATEYFFFSGSAVLFFLGNFFSCGFLEASTENLGVPRSVFNEMGRLRPPFLVESAGLFLGGGGRLTRACFNSWDFWNVESKAKYSFEPVWPSGYSLLCIGLNSRAEGYAQSISNRSGYSSFIPGIIADILPHVAFVPRLRLVGTISVS